MSISRTPWSPEDTPDIEQSSKSLFCDSDYLVSKLLEKEMWEQYYKLEQCFDDVNFGDYYYLSWNYDVHLNTPRMSQTK